MIKVTKLSGIEYYINADIIEFIEMTPDTMITLSSGKKLIVLEQPDVLIERIIAYRQQVYVNLPKVTRRAE